MHAPIVDDVMEVVEVPIAQETVRVDEKQGDEQGNEGEGRLPVEGEGRAPGECKPVFFCEHGLSVLAGRNVSACLLSLP